MDGFLSSFFLGLSFLFLSELGDKSQLAVISLSLEDYSCFRLTIGAALGFAAIVAVGGVIASSITHFFPVQWISLGTGAIFLGIGCAQLLTYFRQGKSTTETVLQEKIDFLPNDGVIMGFIAIFLMEIGDKTQVTMILLTTQCQSVLGTLVGSWLALSVLACIGALAGGILAKKIPKDKIDLFTALLYISIGVITFTSLFPKI